MKYILIILLILAPFAPADLCAQESGAHPDTERVEMADDLRASGKIYVVVLVVMTVFSGLMVYALLTDRKLQRLEKEISLMEGKSVDREKIVH